MKTRKPGIQTRPERCTMWGMDRDNQYELIDAEHFEINFGIRRDRSILVLHFFQSVQNLQASFRNLKEAYCSFL